MKKTTIILITVLFMVIGYAAYNTTINIYGNGKLAENLSDFNVYLSNLKVNEKEVSGINNTKEEFTINDINGDISVDVVNDSTEYDTESYLECASIITPDKTEWAFDYTGAEQTFTAPVTGTYKLEVWGAQGGNNGGKGAYASGTIELKSDDNLYIYVGGKGSKNDAGVAQEVPGGYNGGGLNHGQNCCSRVFGSGGGATDVRLKNGTWNDFDSLKSRIMVAAGGGGTFSDGTANSKGGAGGTLTGKSATGDYSDWCRGLGGTQILGGKIEESSGQYCAVGTNSTYTAPGLVTGGFGTGGSHGTAGNNSTGGGSGYYGGSSSGHIASAGGGSSFISGYTGCNAISENSTKNNIIHTGQSIHYSGYYFTGAVMKSGDETMPTHNGSSTMTGNSGNGYARIILNSSSSKEVSSTDPTIIEAQDRKTITRKNINTNNLTCKLKFNKLSRTEKAYDGPTEWAFDYTGGEQTFTAPVNGTYKLEVWGAQGGGDTSYTGGYGGYSIGHVSLINGKILYINVAEKGKYCTGNECIADNTYNGGGYCKSLDNQRAGAISSCGSGGGATHIATKSGLLYTLKENKNSLVIVAGGGGGANYCNGFNYANGGHGGGYIGTSAINIGARDFSANGGLEATGGTQTSGYAFGQGSKYGNSSNTNVGGGSGLYGGKSSTINGAGGGSGYIGNSLLTEKTMYCYNCAESDEESTKTISTTCTSATPTANCAKQGNGYAKITLISLH